MPTVTEDGRDVSRNPFALAARAGRREAFGYVAQDNVVDVHAWLMRLLFDDDSEPRPYAWTSSYEYRQWRPELRVGQRAEKVEIVGEGTGRPAVMVVDTYGVWSLDGALPSQPRSETAEAKALGKSHYVALSDRGMQARLRTPEGKLAWWQLELWTP